MGKHEKILDFSKKIQKKKEKNSFSFWKNNFGSDNDTEIGPWFWSHTTPNENN